MSRHVSMVASFVDPAMAGRALGKLRRAGFDMEKLCVLGREPPLPASEIAGARCLRHLDELDPVGLGCIPEERLQDYEAGLAHDRVLFVAHGSPNEIERARTVIVQTAPEGWDGKVSTNIFYGCID